MKLFATELRGKTVMTEDGQILGVLDDFLLETKTGRIQSLLVVAAESVERRLFKTDPEGRLILSDAIYYTAKRFRPRAMMDLATLTYAVGAALGLHHAGLLSNDDELARRLIAAGEKTGERLWETQAVTKEKRRHTTAFLVRQGDHFFINNDRGDLIIARLTPQGYQEISRWKMHEPTSKAYGRMVVWSHPAFAQQCVFARNDKELICVSLAK